MSVRVDRATLEDLDRLVELMAEFYAETNFPFDRPRSSAAFERLLADPRWGSAWLLHWEGALAGYFVMTLGFSMEYGGPSAFLDDLFVRPAFRGRGLGRASLATLRAECEAGGVWAVHLEVARDNAAAQALYRDAGFTGRDDLDRLTLRLP